MEIDKKLASFLEKAGEFLEKVKELFGKGAK
jgi:hypothetical protein